MCAEKDGDVCVVCVCVLCVCVCVCWRAPVCVCVCALLKREVCSTKEWRGPTERRIRLQLDGSERRNMVPHVLRKSSPSVHGDNPSPLHHPLSLFPSFFLLFLSFSSPPPTTLLLPWFTADRNKARAGVMGWMLGQEQHWTLYIHTVAHTHSYTHICRREISEGYQIFYFFWGMFLCFHMFAEVYYLQS